MRPLGAVAVAVALLATLVSPVPPAWALTTCRLGGPTPSWSARRITLAEPAELAVRLTAPPPTVPVGGRDGWHVAAGLVIVDAATGGLVAARVGNYGSAPRRAVVRADGQDVIDHELVGPDAPFEHRGGSLPPSLSKGTYYLVGFGSDGGPGTPSLGWSAEVSVGADVDCVPVGKGKPFELDHTDFEGGTQVTAYGAGVVQDVTARLRAKRELVVGLMDVATQVTTPAEGARLDYAFPDGRSGSLSEEIVPFAGPAGEYRFRGQATGAFPLLLVSGVMLDVDGGRR